MTDIERLLVDHWAMTDVVLTPLPGGMNSDTWLVEGSHGRFVAKVVPRDGVDALASGCRVATELADVGLETGAPLPTSAGALLVPEHGIALLRHVAGHELDGDGPDDQVRMAATLARVHRARRPELRRGLAAFMTDWVAPDAPGVASHAWLARAITDVLSQTEELRLTWTLVHSDPAPEAFVHDLDTGVTALIDWAGAMEGPALYDVASAVMYLGGTQHAGAFLTAYAAEGPLEATELAHLDSLRRLREVVQGSYFARRVAADDTTGGGSRADNETGLADARRRLAALGVDCS